MKITKQPSTITMEALTSVKGGACDLQLALLQWLGTPGHPVGNAIGNAVNRFLTKEIGS
jgi:hypothetical protein